LPPLSRRPVFGQGFLADFFAYSNSLAGASSLICCVSPGLLGRAHRDGHRFGGSTGSYHGCFLRFWLFFGGFPALEFTPLSLVPSDNSVSLVRHVVARFRVGKRVGCPRSPGFDPDFRGSRFKMLPLFAACIFVDARHYLHRCASHCGLAYPEPVFSGLPFVSGLDIFLQPPAQVLFCFVGLLGAYPVRSSDERRVLQ